MKTKTDPVSQESPVQFPSLRASFVCLLSALGLIVASRAVTQTEVASGIYADTVDVRVVNVEVFVTDKKGRRVEGMAWRVDVVSKSADSGSNANDTVPLPITSS